MKWSALKIPTIIFLCLFVMIAAYDLTYAFFFAFVIFSIVLAFALKALCYLIIAAALIPAIALLRRVFG